MTRSTPPFNVGPTARRRPTCRPGDATDPTQSLKRPDRNATGRRIGRSTNDPHAALPLLVVICWPATLLVPSRIDDPDVARHVVLALSYATLAVALLGIALATRWLKQWLLLRSGRCVRCGFFLDDPTCAPTEARCTDCGCPAGGQTRRNLKQKLRRRVALTTLSAIVAGLPTYFWIDMSPTLYPHVLTPELRIHLTINLAVAAAIAVLIVALNNPRELLAGLGRGTHRLHRRRHRQPLDPPAATPARVRSAREDLIHVLEPSPVRRTPRFDDLSLRHVPWAGPILALVLAFITSGALRVLGLTLAPLERDDAAAFEYIAAVVAAALFALAALLAFRSLFEIARRRHRFAHRECVRCGFEDLSRATRGGPLRCRDCDAPQPHAEFVTRRRKRLLNRSLEIDFTVAVACVAALVLILLFEVAVSFGPTRPPILAAGVIAMPASLLFAIVWSAWRARRLRRLVRDSQPVYTARQHHLDAATTAPLPVHAQSTARSKSPSPTPSASNA